MFILDYLYWHYAIAPGEIFVLLKNYSAGVWHKFLITGHLRTLFAPWHRSKPSDLGGSSGLQEKFSGFVVDFYITIVAAFVRLCIIISGLISQVLIFVVFVLVMVIWLLWPAIVIFFLYKGVLLII